jgi:uncharacterized protein YfkK (UPF0435 family)
MHTPDREDLFERAKSAYECTLEAIARYQLSLPYFMQNPGTPLTQKDLEEYYQAYLRLRGELLAAFQQDMVEADSLCTESMEAVQATEGRSFEPARRRAQAAVQPKAKPTAGPRRKPTPTTDWEQALEEISEALEMVDGLPEKAEDFGHSVQEKLENMACWIEEHESVTPAQLSAIENMKAGLERWLH